MNQGALTLTDSVLKQNVSDAAGGGMPQYRSPHGEPQLIPE